VAERDGGGGGVAASEVDDTGKTEARTGNGGGSNMLVLRGRGGEAPVEDPRLSKGGIAARVVLVVRSSVAGPVAPDPIDDPVRLGGGGRGASAVGLLFKLAVAAAAGLHCMDPNSSFQRHTANSFASNAFLSESVYEKQTWYYDLGNLGPFQPPNWQVSRPSPSCQKLGMIGAYVMNK